jgi:DNA-binding NtrC family response regulator
VDVRILAATNANLQDLMSNGGFRRDLFYRLARYTVYVPPLRERKEDIPLLAEHFLRLFAAEMTRETPHLGRGALAALEAYEFPGNIRELKNMMERAMLECEGKEIQVHHLHFLHPGPQPIVPDSATPSKEEIGWPDFERQEFARIQQAMTQTSGNITKAARLLGINRSRIYRMLRRHSLSQ